MKLEGIIAFILSLIFVFSIFAKHRSSVDLEKTEDLKKLHSISDLFMN